MARDGVINNSVRHKLRELRRNRKLSLQDLAARAGIPPSSYACMEGGFYNISLDNLFRILGVLEADIREVWPEESSASESLGHPFYIRKIQEFRMSEVISLCQAEGAALFSIEGGRCSVVLRDRLSDFLLDRLVLYLEEGRRYEHGIWFEKKIGGKNIFLFIKAQECPDYVRKLVAHYMVIWASLFDSDLA
jgi:transcriptional regulator with XRE-family HTH domain